MTQNATHQIAQPGNTGRVEPARATHAPGPTILDTVPLHAFILRNSMETAKTVLVDTMRVLGLLAAILAVPALLITFAPNFPRTIASIVTGLF
jgi:hypothetical protein